MTINSMEHPVAILNTSIVTSAGTFTLAPVSLEEARKLASGEIVSAVGHEATAAVLSTLLGREIPVNRIQFAQRPGQVALVFKTRGRVPEGRILTCQELEGIGYDLFTLTMRDGEGQ